LSDAAWKERRDARQAGRLLFRVKAAGKRTGGLGELPKETKPRRQTSKKAGL